jgi:hypothetical protein
MWPETPGRTQRKEVFFFEKKNQKTFIPGAAALSGHGLDLGSGGRIKVFWFFSSEKNTSLILSTQLQAADKLLIAALVFPLQIIQQPAAPANEHQQAAAGMEILRMRLQMLGKIGDALRKQRHLNFGAAGVGCLCLIFANKRRAAFRCDRHRS